MTTRANSADRPVVLRRLSFVLQTLSILVTFAVIGMGVLANRTHRQTPAVISVKASGGSGYYD